MHHPATTPKTKATNAHIITILRNPPGVPGTARLHADEADRVHPGGKRYAEAECPGGAGRLDVVVARSIHVDGPVDGVRPLVRVRGVNVPALGGGNGRYCDEIIGRVYVAGTHGAYT